MRGGIGRPTRKAVKDLVAEIRAMAAAQNVSGELAHDVYQELLNRADALESRLKSARVHRENKRQAVRQQMQLGESEQQRMLNEATEPFSAPPGHEWLGAKVINGEVVWLLIAPVPIKIITRKDYERLNKSQRMAEAETPAT
jgi:hypothetical protein